MNKLTRFLLGLVGRKPCANHLPRTYTWDDSDGHTFEVVSCPNCNLWKNRLVKTVPRCGRHAGTTAIS